MLTTIMKYVVIATSIAGTFWRPAPDPRSYLDFVIAAGGVFVLVQAVSLRKYWWAAVFAAVICLFNPIQPIGLSVGGVMALRLMSAALFAASLLALRSGPRMTIASITEANPQTESL